MGTAATVNPVSSANRIEVAVCGAHLCSLPLNWQLSERGAALVKETRTSDKYRFYALKGGAGEASGAGAKRNRRLQCFGRGVVDTRERIRRLCVQTRVCRQEC